MGAGMGGLVPYVLALTAFDDGNGQDLYAGGYFTTAGGSPASRIARWDGSTWSTLGSGMNEAVFALTVFDDGSGPALYAGGRFPGAVDSSDSFLARWSGCPDSVPPVLTCPPLVRVVDEFSDPGEVVHFSVTAQDNLDPAPLVECTPPSGSAFPRGTTVVTCTATDADGNQAIRQFPVIVQLKPHRR